MPAVKAVEVCAAEFTWSALSLETDACFQAVEMLVRLCRVSHGVRQWLAEHREELDWVSDNSAPSCSCHPFVRAIDRMSFG